MNSEASTSGGRQTITTGDLARATGAELLGRDDLVITGIDALDRAGPGAITFIRTDKFARQWAGSPATAAMVSRGLSVPGHDPALRALLFVADADLALIRTLDLLRPASDSGRPAPGVHPTALVDPGAVIDPSASIGPMCYLARGVRIGPRTTLVARVSVLHDCVIGSDCVLWPGVVIGCDGFGYRPGAVADGSPGLVKIPHLGNVEIGNHVEIGVNSCVDRARFGSTTIGDGTKIDNLVQIAHNCRVGRCCAIAGQVGLSGSVTLGDFVMLGGGVGIADNVTLGAGVKVAAKSGVLSDVPPGETFAGLPALPGREYFRVIAALRRIAAGKRG